MICVTCGRKKDENEDQCECGSKEFKDKEEQTFMDECSG